MYQQRPFFLGHLPNYLNGWPDAGANDVLIAATTWYGTQLSFLRVQVRLLSPQFALFH